MGTLPTSYSPQRQKEDEAHFCSCCGDCLQTAETGISVSSGWCLRRRRGLGLQWRDCQCGYGVHHQYWHWQPPGYLPVCHGRHWCWQRLCRLCLLGDELRGCELLEAQAVDYKFEITLINFK